MTTLSSASSDFSAPDFFEGRFNSLPVGKTPFSDRDKPTFLMCPPQYFTLAYAINPWMSQAAPVDQSLAQRQWDRLREAIEHKAGTYIELLEPVAGLPDLVFTANAAFVYGKLALIARYKHPERQPEEAHCAQWFTDKGFDVVRLPDALPLEGTGDALLWEQKIFAGYGMRSHPKSHAILAEKSGLEVISLELRDPSYYHIDVCLCPLADGSLLYAPSVFTPEGVAQIAAHVPPEKRIPVSAEEVARFACNAVSINDSIIVAQGSPAMEEALRTRGFNVIPLDLSEFLKSGGSAKCLSLRVG
jgi:N-dimethylarginine dimethylaminohydrolase